jgi:hypothetical protein
MKKTRIIMQAIVVDMLEMIMIVGFVVSKMNATETAARNTPKYRPALLRRNPMNSVRMTSANRNRRINIDANAKMRITAVYVISVQ